VITLYTFGPAFGLPDPSPFCMKSLAHLQMTGLPFETAVCDPRKAPKGKGPWMDDGGSVVPDSTFIRWHLEERHGVDFDGALSEEQKATAWAFEKMCEDHLYWALVYERWMLDENFQKGPRFFFEEVPGLLRPLVIRMVRGGLEKALHGQGFGRHSYAELQRLAIRDLEAISVFLGDKPFLMGDAPCGADAAVHAMVSGLLCELFQTPVQAAAAMLANLVRYRDRGLAAWYPDFDG